ncbi:MAG: hypothetical protein R3195_09715 [Gemmatimonadota bacterium]|nr:hypothetical protein [Gemmatimonadota bacterium]
MLDGLLGLIAELAIGFTGFAALASVLGHSPTEADLRLDRFRLRNLVEMGVFTVVMALLPLILRAGEASEMAGRATWVVCCVLMLGGMGFIAVVQIGRSHTLDISSLRGYSRPASLLVYLLAVVAAMLLVLGLALPGFSPARAYVGALFLFVLMLGSYFVRIASSLLTHRLDDGE